MKSKCGIYPFFREMQTAADFVCDFLGLHWLISAVVVWGGSVASGGTPVSADMGGPVRILCFTRLLTDNETYNGVTVPFHENVLNLRDVKHLM